MCASFRKYFICCCNFLIKFCHMIFLQHQKFIVWHIKSYLLTWCFVFMNALWKSLLWTKKRKIYFLVIFIIWIPLVIISVADPGCLSRIPDPDFYPSRIPDPKTGTKERGEKKFYVISFYVATNFTNLNIILVLKCWRKKFGPIFIELQNFLPKKLSLNSPKVWVWDPGSGKNLFRIPDPGVKKAPDPGSRIRIRNTGYNCVHVCLTLLCIVTVSVV